jgi:tetratricopeptide (TPR) repeat protein
MANMDVALGWHVIRRFGSELFWHNGQTRGFKSFIGFDKEKKRGIVILSNGGNPVDDIALHALNTNYKLQSFKYPWVVKDTIFATLISKNVCSAIDLYNTLKQEQNQQYLFNEFQLASVATELLQVQKHFEAIEILKLNVNQYPKSWKALNNLGEAYRTDGNEKLAIEAYEKAIALNPENVDGIENLKKMKM